MKEAAPIQALLGIEEAVEERLQKKQEHKKFRDAGKRVSGSRKEKAAYRQLIQVGDLVNLEKDAAMADELVKKDKVFPKVDIEAEKDKGVSSGAAFLKTEIYRLFPVKPHILSAEARKYYVAFAAFLVKELEQCLTVKDVRELSVRIARIGRKDALELFDVDVGQFGTESMSGIYTVLGSKFYYFIARSFYRSKTAKGKWEQAAKYEAYSAEDAAIALKAWNEVTEQRISELKGRIRDIREMNEQELKVEKKRWTNVGRYTLEDFRRVIIANYNRQLNSAQAKLDNPPEMMRQRDDDWSWTGKKSRSSTPRTDLVINAGLPLSHIKRKGGLAITDVSEQEVIRLFGFKAVEFGHYVKDEEAEQHIRHFLGACADMFEILNFDPVQVNHMNDLAISFGSRGRGGRASATYHPAYKIINLTKSRGDGALVHEWAHFFDNLIFNHYAEAVTRKPYASSNWQGLHSKAPEIYRVYRQLFRFINDAMYKDSKVEDNREVPVNYPAQSKNKVRLSHYIGTEQPESVEKTIELLRDYDPRIFMFGYYSNHASYTKKLFGWVAHHFGKPYIRVPMRIKGTSRFLFMSGAMSSPYWAQPFELFARAFETYIYDKLDKAGRVNNYLVSGAYFDHPAGVYPSGREREILFELYEELMQTVKAVFSLSDFAPFTDMRTDEYIDLDESSKEEKVEAGLVVTHPLISPILRLEMAFYKLTG